MTSKIADIRQSYVDGRFVRGDGPPLAVENPATEETVAEVETLTVAQMEEAIMASRRAFDSGGWSRLRLDLGLEILLLAAREDLALDGLHLLFKLADTALDRHRRLGREGRAGQKQEGEDRLLHDVKSP